MRQQPTAPGWRRLPPRYRTHEEEIVSVLALAAVDDLPLLRGLKAALAWLKEMAGRGGRQAARLADQVREGSCGRARSSRALAKRHLSLYASIVIVGFRHKGLRRFFGRGDVRGVDPRHIPKLRRVLSVLHQAERLSDLRPFTFLRLHPLKGERKGRWAVDVSGNWRLTFSVTAEGEFAELDYEDYH